MILFANVGFLAYWAYEFFQEQKKTLMIKHAWIYQKVCVCHKKDHQRFQREQQMILRRVQNEAEVAELEALIDTLQQAKDIYASGAALDKDQKFRHLFKKFYNDIIVEIDINKVQSESEQRLNMMLS